MIRLTLIPCVLLCAGLLTMTGCSDSVPEDELRYDATTTHKALKHKRMMELQKGGATYPQALEAWNLEIYTKQTRDGAKINLEPVSVEGSALEESFQH